MTRIWSASDIYRRIDFKDEAELESSIHAVKEELFGHGRIYIDVKKKIGKSGGIKNIPDGYLIDLSGKSPRLYVVENELASHDPLRHIATQILEFSLSFAKDQATVKKILLEALKALPEAEKSCTDFVKRHDYRNLDHLLEAMIVDAPFSALVIIDEIQEELDEILSNRFNFGVEVLQLAMYETPAGKRVYRFSPFLSDVSGRGTSAEDEKAVDVGDIDTVVVPAREEGFRDVFLGENCWYKVRINSTLRPQLKYIASYQVAPISAITHLAPIRAIELYKDSGKCILKFSEPAKKIGPIDLVPHENGGRVRAPQNLRYTTKEKLDAARTLDDLW